MSEAKHYLGDSVYADIENGMVKLTTEDGLTVSNVIYLEPEVWGSLARFVARARAAPPLPSPEAES